MGGYGSGRPRTRAHLGQLLRLDVRKLGQASVGSWSTMLWANGSRIGVVNQDAGWEVQFSVDNVPTTQYVPELRVPCHFGGSRRLTRCPRCWKCCRNLYLYRRQFVCRRCTGLRYWTQSVDPMSRFDCAIRKLQRRLANPGEDVNDWDLEYFPKPMWMRYRTHEKLVNKGLELVERRDSVWMIGAARLLSRLGGWPPNDES
jgi:hypothetical protein